MRSLRHLLGVLPVPKQLALVVLLFVGIVGCLLLLVHVQLEVMSAVRAYVGGEGLWSKGQRDAVFHLRAYAAGGSQHEWAAYQKALAVPLGDRRARELMERPGTSLAAVTEGFVTGRNHPADVPVMVTFFGRFRHFPYVAEAIALWAAADREIVRLRRLGDGLRTELTAQHPNHARIDRLVGKIDAINARVTPLEDGFSATLGEGARLLKHALFAVTLAIAGVLVGLTVALAWMLARQIAATDTQRRATDAALRASEERYRQLFVNATEDGRVAAALARVGRELISSVDGPTLYERCCQLTGEVLSAVATQMFVWQSADDTYVAVADWSGDGTPAALTTLPREILSALRATSADGDVAEPAPGLLAMALRRGADVAGVLLARMPDGAEPSSVERRIVQGTAAIAAMALANARLVSELEQASRLKSEFVSTMSHELRTPLNVILGYAEMSREEDPESVRRQEYLERIEAAGRDLLGLIETTLEIGRVEAGRDVVRLEAVPLRTFLGALGEGCARLRRRDSVALEWPADLPDQLVTTDPRKLTVVIRNLVGNALKFTEAGAVRVTVTLDAAVLQLAVADTGIGIRAEDQQHVFEMFRQADGSTTRRFGGTGLGLYIVHKFVQQLGGTIVLDSALGRGSTFTVRLPRVTAPAAISRAA